MNQMSKAEFDKALEESQSTMGLNAIGHQMGVLRIEGESNDAYRRRLSIATCPDSSQAGLTDALMSIDGVKYVVLEESAWKVRANVHGGDDAAIAWAIQAHRPAGIEITWTRPTLWQRVKWAWTSLVRWIEETL